MQGTEITLKGVHLLLHTEKKQSHTCPVPSSRYFFAASSFLSDQILFYLSNNASFLWEMMDVDAGSHAEEQRPGRFQEVGWQG